MAASITIDQIGRQIPNTPFIISGTYAYLSPTPQSDTLAFGDEGGPVKGVVSLKMNMGGSEAWQQIHPGLPAGQHTVRIKCASTGLVVSSNAFEVAARRRR